jgi:hypothetical protein
MTTHTDTAKLNKYQPGRYPAIPGNDQNFIAAELVNISGALNKMVDVLKLMEARMNTNGLT